MDAEKNCKLEFRFYSVVCIFPYNNWLPHCEVAACGGLVALSVLDADPAIALAQFVVCESAALALWVLEHGLVVDACETFRRSQHVFVGFLA